MCVIVDANIAPKLFSTPAQADFRPLIRWIIRGGGSIVTGGRNLDELRRVRAAADFIQEQDRRGRAHLTQPDSTLSDPVDLEEKRLADGRLCRSDDPHVVALARVSGARTLCSHDQDLAADFTNATLVAKPRGAVYKRAEHEHLLRHTSGCPGRASGPRRRARKR